VIPVRLPPLRERREDIPLLVDHFVRKYSQELDTPPKRLTPEALACLEAYRWPGNVRELENMVERTLALTAGPVVELADLPPVLRAQQRLGARAVELPSEGMDLEAYLEDVRAGLMRQALDRCSGVQTRAAELLGMSFRSFRYYAKKAGIVGGGDEELEVAATPPA
jgi:two-component system response regulator PilR (NtrC family)